MSREKSTRLQRNNNRDVIAGSNDQLINLRGILAVALPWPDVRLQKVGTDKNNIFKWIEMSKSSRHDDAMA